MAHSLANITRHTQRTGHLAYIMGIAIPIEYGCREEPLRSKDKKP
jgi:hypothetical protein